MPFSASHYFRITFRTCSDDIHASASQVPKSLLTKEQKKNEQKKQNNIKQDGMNITHTKVLEPKKQTKIPPQRKKEAEEDAEFGKRSRPTPPSLVFFLLRGVWWWVGFGRLRRRKKSKSRERHSSFIIRVVNFMTGWIPDSPPPPFSYFYSFFFTINPSLFFFISAFYFVVASLDVRFLFHLPFDRWLSSLSIWFLLQFRARSHNFFHSGIPESKER